MHRLPWEPSGAVINLRYSTHQVDASESQTSFHKYVTADEETRPIAVLVTFEKMEVLTQN